MPIPQFMAPNINVGATCTNCLHRHTGSTCSRCTLCQGKATAENPFPQYEVDEIEN